MRKSPSIWLKNLLLVSIMLVSAPILLDAQELKNVRDSFDQAKQQWLIFYDLKAMGFKRSVAITPFMINAGDTIPLPKDVLSGEFGLVTRGGRSKCVRWDVFRTEGLDSLAGVKFWLEAPMKPSFWAIEAQASNSAPFGLKIIRSAQVGFYAGFRLGKLPVDYRYRISDAGAMEYDEPGIYRVGTARRLASWAATAGGIFPVGRRTYISSGLGYGIEQLFWRYEAFGLDKEPLGNYWALNKHFNRRGLMVELSAGRRMSRRWLIGLGVSSIAGRNLQVIGSLGYIFSEKKEVQSTRPENLKGFETIRARTSATADLMPIRRVEDGFFDEFAAAPQKTLDTVLLPQKLSAIDGQNGLSERPPQPSMTANVLSEPANFYKITKKTSLRPEPDAAIQPLQRLQVGQRVRFIEKRDKYWWRVVTDEGKEGFVKQECLEKI